MYYYAMLNPNTGVCYQLTSMEELVPNDEVYIRITTYDEEYYINRVYDYDTESWGNYAGASLLAQYKTDDINYKGRDVWLNDFLGEQNDLATTSKNLVGAINELFTEVSNALKVEVGSFTDYTQPTSISISTSFIPKIVIMWNTSTLAANSNLFVFANAEITGASSNLSRNLYYSSSTYASAYNVFTIPTVEPYGFTVQNVGSTNTMNWIALG